MGRPCCGCGKETERHINRWYVCAECLPAEKVDCSDCGAKIDLPDTDKPYRCADCQAAFQEQQDKIPRQLRAARDALKRSRNCLDPLWATKFVGDALFAVVQYLIARDTEED